MTENDIMRRLVRGEEDAWREVFPVLFGDAVQVCRGHHMLHLPEVDAEDIAQEAVTEVILEVDLKRLSTMKDLRRFTRAVALKRGIDHVRRITARKRGSGEVGSLDAPIGDGSLTRLDLLASAFSVRKAMDWVEFLTKLDEVITTRLNEKEREMIRLFYLKDCPQKEIAEKLEVPIGSVGATLKRALGKIEAALTEIGISLDDFLGRNSDPN